MVQSPHINQILYLPPPLWLHQSSLTSVEFLNRKPLFATQLYHLDWHLMLHNPVVLRQLSPLMFG